MEEKPNIVKQKDSDQSSPHRPPADNNRSNQQDKVPRKSKKDNLNDKKKSKKKPKEENSIVNANPSAVQSTLSIPSPHQPITEPLNKAFKEISQKMNEHNLPHPLDKLLKRPSYIHIGGFNRIYGTFGHSTTYFKRPILQGNFYMQFIFREDKKVDKKTAFPPSVRLGLCEYKFNHSFPLGCDESIAYKSTDGSIIYKGQTIHKGQSFTVGDLITIFIKMSPPYKHPDPNKVSQNSSVSFYKNTTLIYQFLQPKQTFYCFSASTFNYSQVEFVTKPTTQETFAAGKHYFEWLKEPIKYKDLQESGIFKI